MKKYKDASWLKEQYVEKDRILKDIANECGVSLQTINNWIHKFGLTKEEIARKNPLNWSKSIAYLSGLITADGCLRKGEFRTGFASKDYSLIKQIEEIAEDSLNISSYTLDQRQDGTWYCVFASRKLYYFLEGIGLMSNKSHKLGVLNIPDDMFLPWLRGEIDGDGCFGIYRNRL